MFQVSLHTASQRIKLGSKNLAYCHKLTSSAAKTLANGVEQLAKGAKQLIKTCRAFSASTADRRRECSSYIPG